MVLLRKAQMETFGLLIIVILIVFIAVFAIRLSLFQPRNTNTYVKDSIIANNVVSSITKVTICEKQQLTKILRNCYNNVNSCNQDSCQLLSNELSKMMTNAGFNSNEYKLIASTKEKELFNIGNCNIQAGNVITSSPYQIYLEGSSAIIKFYLCR